MKHSVDIPDEVPEDMEDRTDQHGWNTARELAALCNGSAPTREQIIAITGTSMRFEDASALTRALIHIEHTYFTEEARESIAEVIGHVVVIPERY